MKQVTIGTIATHNRLLCQMRVTKVTPTLVYMVMESIGITLGKVGQKDKTTLQNFNMSYSF